MSEKLSKLQLPSKKRRLDNIIAAIKSRLHELDSQISHVSKKSKSYSEGEPNYYTGMGCALMNEKYTLEKIMRGAYGKKQRGE